MSKTRETRISLAASPDDVLAAVTSEGFLIERDKAQGALTVEIEERSRSETALEVAVKTTRYGHGFTGIDKSKTETSTVTLSWDLTTKRATWVYSGPHGDRASVSGTIAIEPEGSGSALVETMRIEVRVPLLGGQIESMILKGMNKGFATYERVVRKHVEG